MSFAPTHLPPVLGLLDIGTSKIVCLILARTEATTDSPYRVIGFGHQRARGLKASVVIDADAAEETVRATVTQAELMAGLSLEHVVIAAGCGRVMSTHVAAGLDLATADAAGRPVTPDDIDRLIAAGRTHAERDDRAVLNINALAARLDDVSRSDLAIGASGRRLSVDVHAITVDRAPLRHLMHVVERCQLTLIAIAPAPMAAALAVTTTDERQTGVIVIDFGAGSTGLAIYVAGTLACTHVFPIGGNHLTFDLMRALGTSFTEAERIKKNYAIEGSAHDARDDAIAYLGHEIPHAETDKVAAKQITRADISHILTSRLDALLRQVLHRIDQLVLPTERRLDVILTGGGSAAVGLPALAALVLARPARVAAPAAHTQLPRMLMHPAFATAAGLAQIARQPDTGLRFDQQKNQSIRVNANGTNLRHSL